jgi:hypothetical protein
MEDWMATGADMLKTSIVALREMATLLSRVQESGCAEDLTSAAARLQEIGKRIEGLGQKVTLRAKGGDNLAFPVAEATARLKESFEALNAAGAGSRQDALADLQADLETLERETGVLEEAVRARTVVVT